MKEVFKSFNFRGALNAEHYQVHGDLLNAISEELASSLDLSDLRDRYGSLYAEENNSFFLSRASEWTPEIQEAHQLRVQQFGYILNRIDGGLYAGEESKPTIPPASETPTEPEPEPEPEPENPDVV